MPDREGLQAMSNTQSMDDEEFMAFMEVGNTIEENVAIPMVDEVVENIAPTMMEEEIVEPTTGNSSNNELFKGKCFTSLEAAEEFYHAYAGRQGFSIRRRSSSKRGRSEVPTGAVFGKFGKRSMEVAYKFGKSEEGFQLFSSILDQAWKQAEELDDTLLRQENNHAPISDICMSRVDGPNLVGEGRVDGAISVGEVLLDPRVSVTKGRKKGSTQGGKEMNPNKRIKGGMEIAQGKKGRKCALCKGIGHDKCRCLENPNRKKKELDPESDGDDVDEDDAVSLEEDE